MQHEWVSVSTELCDQKWHALRHQPGNEGDIAREPVELGDDHRAPCLARRVERRPELWPAQQRVAAPTALGLYVLGDDADVLRLGEPQNPRALRLDAKTRSALGTRRHAVVGDRGSIMASVQTANDRLLFARKAPGINGFKTALPEPDFAWRFARSLSAHRRAPHALCVSEARSARRNAMARRVGGEARPGFKSHPWGRRSALGRILGRPTAAPTGRRSKSNCTSATRLITMARPTEARRVTDSPGW